jgi:hypothetical protein
VAIECPELKGNIEHSVGQTISTRTIRRYGHDVGGVRATSTDAKTEQERKYMHTLTIIQECTISHVFNLPEQL